MSSINSNGRVPERFRGDARGVAGGVRVLARPDHRGLHRSRHVLRSSRRGQPLEVGKLHHRCRTLTYRPDHVMKCHLSGGADSRSAPRCSGPRRRPTGSMPDELSRFQGSARQDLRGRLAVLELAGGHADAGSSGSTDTAGSSTSAAGLGAVALRWSTRSSGSIASPDAGGGGRDRHRAEGVQRQLGAGPRAEHLDVIAGPPLPPGELRARPFTGPSGAPVADLVFAPPGAGRGHRVGGPHRRGSPAKPTEPEVRADPPRRRRGARGPVPGVPGGDSLSSCTSASPARRPSTARPWEWPGDTEIVVGTTAIDPAVRRRSGQSRVSSGRASRRARCLAGSDDQSLVAGTAPATRPTRPEAGQRAGRGPTARRSTLWRSSTCCQPGSPCSSTRKSSTSEVGYMSTRSSMKALARVPRRSSR